ncbi:MAG TPA: hypothetical protein VK137_13565 [Planctomycetaceae bacterium]|nr:hypothetical protein [Planctomycetaceae bacterium]
MKTVEVTADMPLSDVADAVSTESILLTRDHEPFAAVVSLHELTSDTLRLKVVQDFREVVERARAEYRAGKYSTLEEVKREFGL